ncbi:glycosyltransferase [Pediococcus argentinicus]|uniref:glycosyltransferase family 2 protein n=1 Tax=Pediococcus argentinicus TaxID=480391 RepID=UPI00338D42D6
MKPLLSVIIPVYNAEKYINSCLSSIIQQSFQDFEIIIINDGSTDNSLKVLNEFKNSNKIKNFIVVNKGNGGVSSARNIGLQNAKGQYVTFLDADDIFEKDHFKLLLQGIENNEIDLSVIGFSRELENGQVVRKTFGKTRIRTKDETVADILELDGYNGFLWNKLFKMDLIRRYDLSFNEEVTITEDLLFCVLYIKYIKKSLYNPYPSYHYIVRNNSAMTQRTYGNEFKDSWFTELTSYDEMIKAYSGNKVAENNILAAKAWTTRYLSGLISEAPNEDERLKKISSDLFSFSMRNLIRVLGSSLFSIKNKIVFIVSMIIPKASNKLRKKKAQRLQKESQ